jgi:hypothetical protein
MVNLSGLLAGPPTTHLKKSCLSFDLVTPNDVLCFFRFRIPGTQEVSKAVMEQALLPCSINFMSLSGTLCQFIIIDRHPIGIQFSDF